MKRRMVCIALAALLLLSNTAAFAAPAAPKSVTAKAKMTGTRGITISWKKVSGAKEYAVYRATSKNGTYKLLKKVKGTSFLNITIVEEKTYYYRVKVRTSSGWSKYSSTVSAKLPVVCVNGICPLPSALASN